MGDDEEEETSLSWLWWVPIGAGVGCLVLLYLWYRKHPDRSPFVDFAQRVDVISANGNGHTEASDESLAGVEGA
jgi:hypothetical protein